MSLRYNKRAKAVAAEERAVVEHVPFDQAIGDAIIEIADRYPVFQTCCTVANIINGR